MLRDDTGPSLTVYFSHVNFYAYVGAELRAAVHINDTDRGDTLWTGPHVEHLYRPAAC